MKRIAIMTIQSINYGNRLQNYALQETLNEFGQCKTIHTQAGRNTIKGRIKRMIRCILGRSRIDMFARFDCKIAYSKGMVSSDGQNNRLVNSFDFFVAGSDQVWNPLFDFIGDREFLTFAKPEQRIAYAASIGLNQLPSQYHDVFLKRLDGFKAIAMRESSGTKIVQDLTDRNDIVTVLDPTMLLSREQWHSVARKSKYQPTRPYIFKYILGVDNPELDQEIEIKAKELKFAIFELHDFSKSDTRAIGPAEFISLIENSEMVFTDSFHGTVFSLLFHRLFFTVQRPYQEGFGEMSSRLETLLDMVEMRERLVDSVDQYKKVDLLCDFRKADKVLEERKALSKRFLRNAFGGDEENYNEN